MRSKIRSKFKLWLHPSMTEVGERMITGMVLSYSEHQSIDPQSYCVNPLVSGILECLIKNSLIFLWIQEHLVSAIRHIVRLILTTYLNPNPDPDPDLDPDPDPDPNPDPGPGPDPNPNPDLLITLFQPLAAPWSLNNPFTFLPWDLYFFANPFSKSPHATSLERSSLTT